MHERALLCVTAASSTLTLPPGSEIPPVPPVWAPLTSGLHRVAYTEWTPASPAVPSGVGTVVCVHGFSRNGRDFDALAERLASRRRVVCPDMPGRGRSAWLGGAAADAGYNLPQYVLDVVTLLARLDVPRVDWVGTSMGGIVGMMLAAVPESPIERLVLNDVGAEVSGAFLDEISTYIGVEREFDTIDEVEAYLRTLYAGFGDLTGAQWRHLADHSWRRTASGRLALAYDPAIGRSLRPPHADQSLWPLWEAIRCPVLVLRGEHSPALPAEVARRMAETGPRATVVEVPGCGHAPALTSAEQTGLVETWLDSGTVSPDPFPR